MNMQEFFNNRYVRMTLITILGALLLYMLLRMVFFFLNLDQSSFPDILVIFISLLVSGYLVNRYLSYRF